MTNDKGIIQEIRKPERLIPISIAILVAISQLSEVKIWLDGLVVSRGLLLVALIIIVGFIVLLSILAIVVQYFFILLETVTGLVLNVLKTLVIAAINILLWLLHCLKLYDTQKLSEDIEIRVRGEGDPATIYSKGKSIPEINLYLEITNKSPYPLSVIFERAVVTVWFFQPFCKLISLERKNIKRGGTETILFREFLNSYQVQELLKLNPSNLKIYSTFYFSSQIVDFEKQYNRESIRVAIH